MIPRLPVRRCSMLTGLLIAICAGLRPSPALCQEPRALDTRGGCAVVESRPVFSTHPLTVECRVRLDSAQSYNIIIANETKGSATHWELFTTPNDGHFTAYMPGRTPDHVRSAVGIVDGKWHWIAMVMEQDRVRLYVDGVEKAGVASAPPTQAGTPSQLAIGALVEGGLQCVGLIDQVRLSASARAITSAPEAPLAADEQTVGLWDFDALELGKYQDLSAAGNDAVFKADTTRVYTDGIVVPGGMPTEYQPLPPPEDVAPLRATLAKVAAELDLHSIEAEAVRDGVLRQWSRDFTWMDKVEHPQSRPSGADPEAVKAQVYDRHSRVWEEDGGAAGTVLRRTEALVEHLREGRRAGKPAPTSGSKPAPRQAEPAQAISDLRTLRAAYDAARPAADSDLHRAYYLAACAIRRQIALSNPLLDFDDLLCVARGTFAGSVRSNPANQDYQGGHFTTQFFGHNALPGGGLFRVRDIKREPRVESIIAGSVVQNGRLSGQKLDRGAFATPDLSFDGKQIVFAWTESSQHRWTYSRHTCWHLFRVDVDGSNLVQLTDGPFNDFDPCFLPDGRIAFVSERRGGYIRCFAAYLKVRNYTLFSMNAEGGDIRPLSYYETSEWNPSVTNEGKLAYTRWDYTDRENCLGTRIWLSGPDGTDPRAPHGNYPHPYHTFEDHDPWKLLPGGREIDSRMGAPLVEMGIRAVPNSHRYICTAAPHHGEAFGSLCMLDIRVRDDGHMSQVRRITPQEPFPETELPGRRHYRFGTPWPLSEDFYLCNEWENLVLLDRFGNKELLCELPLVPCVQDERLRLVEPIPLRPRFRPPIVTWRARTGESAAQHPPATIAVMNVYDSDLPFPPDTRIKWLRVTQNILKTNHAMGEPMIGYERENSPRIPLGIVPVEEDGSVYFKAPVAKELIFQALDDNCMAVQSMRSVAFVHPGEQLSCVGCHEPQEQSPRQVRTPIALRRPPSDLQPELGKIEPISYYRQIRPIFERTCLTCHHRVGKGPQDMSYEALKEGYTFWHAGAMYGDMCSAYSGVHGGSRTIPGRFGARASLIGQTLLRDDHRRAIPESERRAVILWLDSNSLRLGAYIREEAQLRGELVWPTLDVDPESPLGVEGIGRPLRGSFWHENLYGPHAFLCSEHTHDRVAIVDENGRIAWEYPVAHPQDAWLLSNGNVLTSHTHGVREVTPDKQIVWEYKTQPPNEVPTCQPLPDGGVLIGIVGECRLIEVDRGGVIVHEVKLETSVEEPHAQFRMCRKTPQGTYLVPFTAEGAVREYDREGTVIRSFPPRPNPVCALRLEDGHTLISAGGMVTEYDAGLRPVWELCSNDIPDINIGTLAGLQRLPNGNTVVCNWNTRDADGKDGAHIFEVTPDKRVVWQVTGETFGQVAQCQLLRSDLRPREDGIVR